MKLLTATVNLALLGDTVILRPTLGPTINSVKLNPWQELRTARKHTNLDGTPFKCRTMSRL